MLNDVLDFSKIEAGRLELNPIEFALRQHVRGNRAGFVGGGGRKEADARMYRFPTTCPIAWWAIRTGCGRCC